MKFKTKIWQRSGKSFATTIPQAILFLLDTNEKYRVLWEYIEDKNKWYIQVVKKEGKKKDWLSTELWKRSQRSYGTTLPHPVILYIDEDKENQIIWTFDKSLKKWSAEAKEVKK